jgi:hypothetical protein
MVIYPLAEERALLTQLPPWLDAEMRTPGSARAQIIAAIRASDAHAKTGLLSHMLRDLQAVCGEPWGGDYIPVDSEEGQRIPERAEKIAHILARLEQYVRSVPETQFRPGLFRGALARLDVAGTTIAVTELAALLTDGAYCFLCRDERGEHYLAYEEPWGEVGVLHVYHLSPRDVARYARGTLTLAMLQRRVLRARRGR